VLIGVMGAGAVVLIAGLVVVWLLCAPTPEDLSPPLAAESTAREAPSGPPPVVESTARDTPTSSAGPAVATPTPPSPSAKGLAELLIFHGTASASTGPAPDLELVADNPARSPAATQPPPSLPRTADFAIVGLGESERLSALARLTRVQARTPPTTQTYALYTHVVDQFILYDIGQLGGLAGQQALTAFRALGPEAIPQVVHGLNRASSLSASCPIIVISRKLSELLSSCNDLELLTYARDNIGRGMGTYGGYHRSYLTNVQHLAQQRVQEVQNYLTAQASRLVPLVSSTNPNTRRSAVLAIAALPPSSRRALSPEMVPRLVKALKAPDVVVRRHVVYLLGSVGSEARPAVPGLITALADSDPQTRFHAARALAEIGPEAVPALVETLSKPGMAETRCLAALALGESRPASDQAVATLVEGLQDPDSAIRGAVESALAHIGAPAVPALAVALKNRQVSAARALGKIGDQAAAALPELLAALRGPDKALRVEAHDALVRLGASAVPALAEALKSADLRTWHSISLALGKIGPPAAAASPALVEGLKHADSNIRILAAGALTKIDPTHQAARAVFAEALPVFIEALGHTDPAIRAWAAQSLGTISLEPLRILGPFQKALGDRESIVRRRVAEALATLGPQGAAAAPQLVVLLGDQEADVRQAARTTLVCQGGAAVPVLIESLKTFPGEARAGVIQVLSQMKAEAVPALLAALKHTEAPVRRGAVEVLKTQAPLPEAIMSALTGVLADPDRVVRITASSALGESRAATPEAARVLVGLLEDADEQVQAAAREALTQIGKPAVPHLTAKLHSAFIQERRLSAGMLRNLKGEAEAAVPDLIGALKDSDKQVRLLAAEALRLIVQVPDSGDLGALSRMALQAFLFALHDTEAEVRIQGQLGLIRLGKPAVPVVVEALKGTDVLIRRQAVEILKRLRADARSAVPVLVRTLSDADSEVGQGAGWALEEIDPELRTVLPALRKALAQAEPRRSGDVKLRPVSLSILPTREIAAAAATATGQRLKELLRELEERRDETALVMLLKATTFPEPDLSRLADELVLSYMANRPDEKIEETAARRLKLTKKLFEMGRVEAGDRSLYELLKAFPRTRVAEEIRRELAERK
jgi:HEAT repeat protein